MSGLIEDNYSVLNNYSYENKSCIVSALDWLSAPCREVLGGRDVCVLSQIEKMPTVWKISTLFSVVLCLPVALPVAIISTVSLLIKLATCPCFWETKKVRIQSQQARQRITQFNEAFQKGDYDQALLAFNQRPEMGKREEVSTNLFSIVRGKINNNIPWVELQTLLTLLDVEDTINLINHAVKVRLSVECRKSTHFLTAEDIKNLTQHSLGDRSTVKKCYEKLLSDALKIDPNKNLLVNAIKVDIGNQLITSLDQSDAVLLRSSYFTTDYLHLFSFNMIPQITQVVNDIRRISQIEWGKSLRQLHLLSTQELTQQQWKDMREECIKFQESFEKWNLSSEERRYMQSMNAISREMIKVTNAIWEKHNETLQSYRDRMITCARERLESYKGLFDQKRLPFSSDESNKLSILYRHKRAILCRVAENMKESLQYNMKRTALMMHQSISVDLQSLVPSSSEIVVGIA